MVAGVVLRGPSCGFRLREDAPNQAGALHRSCSPVCIKYTDAMARRCHRSQRHIPSQCVRTGRQVRMPVSAFSCETCQKSGLLSSHTPTLSGRHAASLFGSRQQPQFPSRCTTDIHSKSRFNVLKTTKLSPSPVSDRGATARSSS